MSTPAKIAPAHGRLGVLLVGLGAVSTTTIAGVFAIRKGLAKPIGSLTQMGTIRLGKRTEGRSPKIGDVVPLSTLDDLVFGGWDIFEDDCYAAARTAGVIEPSLLRQQAVERTQVINGRFTARVGDREIVSVEAVDSSYWLVWTEDAELLRRTHARFPGATQVRGPTPFRPEG